MDIESKAGSIRSGIPAFDCVVVCCVLGGFAKLQVSFDLIQPHFSGGESGSVEFAVNLKFLDIGFGLLVALCVVGVVLADEAINGAASL